MKRQSCVRCEEDGVVAVLDDPGNGAPSIFKLLCPTCGYLRVVDPPEVGNDARAAA